jgi:hypothetical protein
MIELRKSSGSLVAVIEADDTIVHVSHVVQESVEWMLVQGVWRLSVHRRSTPDGDCLLTCKALIAPKPLLFATKARLEELVEEGYFPKALPAGEEWQQATATVKYRLEGQQQAESKPNGELIENQRLIRPEITVAHYAWGMTERIVPFFVRGATSAKHQGSIEIAQTWLNVGLNEAGVNVADDGKYDANALVRSMRSIR